MGIDYGMGLSNIDSETGIRFGVVPSHRVCQAWADSAEPDYGDPACPKCGNPAIASEARSEQRENGVVVWNEHPDYTEDWECSGCGDYRCEDCEYLFDGDEAFGEEPNGFVLDDGEYKATEGSDGDIFILKSPYSTRCGFCSPCAPGAGYLTDRGDDCRAYCFGPDWFDSENPCPYPIWRVDTGELVYSPAEESDE